MATNLSPQTNEDSFVLIRIHDITEIKQYAINYVTAMLKQLIRDKSRDVVIDKSQLLLTPTEVDLKRNIM